MIKTCKHCKQELKVEKIQQFAHHVSRCEKNPNLLTTLKTIKDLGVERQKRIELKLNCKKCNKEYIINVAPFEINHNSYRKHCSRACSNSRSKIVLFNCLNCGKEKRKHSGKNNVNKYCDVKCQNEYKFKNEILPIFEKGLISNRPTLRKILIKLNGNKCAICNITKWNNKSITLQVDHIDGNVGNDSPKNVRIICPNCHSQTPTFGGGTIGKGRGSRGLSLG